jgi:hypothetical protein
MPGKVLPVEPVAISGPVEDPADEKFGNGIA